MTGASTDYINNVEIIKVSVEMCPSDTALLCVELLSNYNHLQQRDFMIGKMQPLVFQNMKIRQIFENQHRKFIEAITTERIIELWTSSAT